MKNAPYQIKVEVKTQYVPERSDVVGNSYFFAYTITIRNVGAIGARLLTRYWLITDANGETQEVNGEGVVGEQPYLVPGATFRYTSGAVIATPVGSMQGSYQMEADDKMHFDAAIDAFSLACPNTLH